MALAHVVRDRRARPEVCLLERFSLDGNEGQVLQRLKVARRLKSYRCTTLIGDGEYSLSPVEALEQALDLQRDRICRTSHDLQLLKRWKRIAPVAAFCSVAGIRGMPLIKDRQPQQQSVRLTAASD